MELSWVAGSGGDWWPRPRCSAGCWAGPGSPRRQARDRAALEASSQVLARAGAGPRGGAPGAGARSWPRRPPGPRRWRTRGRVPWPSSPPSGRRRAEEQRAMDEKLRLVQVTQEELTERFKALSHDALQANAQTFLEVRQGPAGEDAGGGEGRARRPLHRHRRAGRAAPRGAGEGGRKARRARPERGSGRRGRSGRQLRALADSQDALRQQTERLVGALRGPRTPAAAGVKSSSNAWSRWPESSSTVISSNSEATPDGRLRPDLIVKLPPLAKNKSSSMPRLRSRPISRPSKLQDEPGRTRVLKLKEHARASPQPPQPAQQEVVLGAVRRHTGIRRALSARRDVLFGTASSNRTRH